MNSFPIFSNISIAFVLVFSTSLQNTWPFRGNIHPYNVQHMVQSSGFPVTPSLPVIPHEFNGDLRNLPQIQPTVPRQQIRPLMPGNLPQRQASPNIPTPFVQTQTPTPNMPNPSASFAGLNFSSNGSGWPPDPNGDVGPNYYIQAVNTSIGIFSKTTGALQTSFTFNSFWSGSNTSTACDANNQGDPLVLYDPLADRWIFADMAWYNTPTTNMQTGPFYECFAVSKTSDPVSGGWWKYAVRTDDSAHTYLADYPKLGLWSDGIYMSANKFLCSDASCTTATYEGVRAWAFNRTQMESGATLQSYFVDLNTSYFSLLPSNLRGVPPPSGTPNYFVTFDPISWALDVWKFHVDWSTPANNAFTGPTAVSIASYTDASYTPIPEKGGENLDSLGDRLMMQNQYRNINGTESLWLTHTVGSGGVTGIRWYQLNVTGGTIASSPVQSSTYQPDSNYRWMPSLAVDKMGNMAIGYSISSSTMYPAIAYSGRLTTDSPNTLGQGETILIAGTGAQSADIYHLTSGRWGDYTAMTVDPTDDCTFWYTNEYYSSTGYNWQTRIGSFAFPSCPGITISGNTGVGGVTLSYTDGTGKNAMSDANGNYSFKVSYNWTGTVTPSLACYTFSPFNHSYSNITNDQAVQNYTATLNTGCTPGIGIYDDTYFNWSYVGSWTAYNGIGPYDNTTHYTSTVGDTATFTFSGTQFILTYTQNTDRGSIGVNVDGSQVATINANGTLQWQKTYASPNYPSGTHVVQLTYIGGGNYIDVDAIRILANNNADLNGDGKADLVGFASNGVYVALSTGTGFSPATQWTSGFSYQNGWTSQNTYPRMVADVNGDGKADLVGFASNGVYVALSTGTGFSPATKWTSDFSYQNGWTSQDAYPRMSTP